MVWLIGIDRFIYDLITLSNSILVYQIHVNYYVITFSEFTNFPFSGTRISNPNLGFTGGGGGAGGVDDFLSTVARPAVCEISAATHTSSCEYLWNY